MTDAHAADSWDFGRDVRGYAWRVPSARGNVLLMHGFAEYAERYVNHYSRLIPHLNELGFDVYAFDAQGHGRTSGARGVTDIRRAVADHQAARRALSSQSKPLFVFGHSLGGLIAAASVAENADGVAGVILSAPALLIVAPPHLRLIAKTMAVLAPSFRPLPAGPSDRISRIPAEVEAYDSDPMITILSVTSKVGATAMDVADKAWARYARWTTPVLVFHGARDELTDPKGSERFIATIAATDKHLEFYPEGRHEILNDLDRDAALALLSNWLDTRTARASEALHP